MVGIFSRYKIREGAFLLFVATLGSIGTCYRSFITALVTILLLIFTLWYRFSLLKIDLSLREKVFFIFIAATFAFSKNFSALNVSISGIPFFITEAVLGFLLATIFLPGFLRGKARSVGHPIFLLVGIYFLLGFINLVRGFSSHGAFALRDAVMVGYAGFLLITVEVFDRWFKFYALLKALLPSAIVAVIVGFLMLTGITEQIGILQYSKPINFNFLYGFIMIFILCMYTGVGHHNTMATGLFFASFFLIVIMQVRSIWVSMTVSFAFIFFMVRKQIWHLIPKYILIFTLILPLFVGFGYAINKENMATLGKEMHSIFRSDMDYKSSANNRWRLAIWEQTIRRGLNSHPVLGSGFGADYGLNAGERDVWDIKGVGVNSGIIPPHNGQIALFYKMGFLGLGVFLIMNAYFFLRCFRFYKHCRDYFQKRFMLAIMASQIHFNVGAFFFEAIETPQVGIFLWIIMGLGLAMIQLGSPNETVEAHSDAREHHEVLIND